MRRASDGGRFGAPGGGDRFWKSCLGRRLHLLHVSALTIICHECRGEKNKNAISTNFKIWNARLAVSPILSTLQNEFKARNWSQTTTQSIIVLKHSLGI